MQECAAAPWTDPSDGRRCVCWGRVWEAVNVWWALIRPSVSGTVSREEGAGRASTLATARTSEALIVSASNPGIFAWAASMLSADVMKRSEGAPHPSTYLPLKVCLRAGTQMVEICVCVCRQVVINVYTSAHVFHECIIKWHAWIYTSGIISQPLQSRCPPPHRGAGDIWSRCASTRLIICVILQSMI